MYEAFLDSPESVSPKWRSFFLGFELAGGDLAPGQHPSLPQGGADVHTGYEVDWDEHLRARPNEAVDTRISADSLQSLGAKVVQLPDGVELHRLQPGTLIETALSADSVVKTRVNGRRVLTSTTWAGEAA